MTSKTRLQQLRNEAVNRHKAATAKASRLRRQGVEIAGTEYDPRKPLANIRRMNTKQLETHLGRLNAFTSRQTQFEALENRQPIPRHLANRLVTVEDRLTARAAHRMGKLSDVKLPGQDQTIGQRDADKAKTNRMGEATHGPNRRYKSVLKNIPSIEAFHKTLADREKRLSPTYVKRTLNKQRETAVKVANSLGSSENARRIAELTDEQFDALWNYTAAPESLFAHYSAKAGDGKGNRMSDRAIEAIENTEVQVMSDMLDWAEMIPSFQNKPTRKRR